MGQRATLFSLGQERRSWPWALALASLFALRVWALDQDPLLVSPSGLYLTDEGWYSKAARQIVQWNIQEVSTDFVPITHTFGYTWLCVAVFKLAGVSLWSLRALSLSLSGLGLIALSWSVARRWGARAARWLALGLTLNVLLISLTRLAIPDTVAFALCGVTMALLLACRTQTWLRPLCAVFAVFLSIIKLSYLPVTIWFCTMLACHFIRWPLSKTPNRSRILAAFSLLLPLGLCTGIYAAIARVYPKAWAMFSNLNLRDRMVTNPLEWIANLFYAVGADIWSTGSIGLVGLLALQSRVAPRPFWRQREGQALLLLLALGWSARSLIWYHPPRYGLVSALVFLMLSILSTRDAIRQAPTHLSRHTRRWVLALMLGQLPQLGALMLHGHSGDSMQRSASQLAQTIAQIDAPTGTLYGSGSASFIALLHPQLRSVDIADTTSDMCTRIDHFGPGYLVIDDRKAEQFKIQHSLSQCQPDVLLEALGQWQVLNNYYRQGPWRLYRLSRTGPPTQH